MVSNIGLILVILYRVLRHLIVTQNSINIDSYSCQHTQCDQVVNIDSVAKLSMLTDDIDNNKNKNHLPILLLRLRFLTILHSLSK